MFEPTIPPEAAAGYGHLTGDESPATRSLRRVQGSVPATGGSARPTTGAIAVPEVMAAAGSGSDPRSDPRSDSWPEAGRGVVAPSRNDPVVRVASQVVGGPAGRRLATRHRAWQASTLLVLLAVVMLGLGVVQKQHCRAAGWVNPDQFWHACYSDIPVLYGSSALGGSNRPDLQQAVRSGSLGPPVQAAAMWAVSGLVQGGSTASAPRRFFDVSALVLGAVLSTTVALVVLGAGRRRWDAAHVALAPILVTSALVNYDLLGIAVMTAALIAWARRHPLAAGVLFGLAAGAKPLTAVVAVAVFAVALRAGRSAQFGVLAVAGVLTWLGLRLLLFPGYGMGLGSSWQSFKAAMPGYGSLWLVPQLLTQSQPTGASLWYTGPVLGASATTTASLLGLLAVIVVTLTLALVTADRPRLAPLALFAVAASLVVSKTLPVQASLILLPLLALAGLRWRDHLLWATAEVAYFAGTWLFIAGASKPDRGLPAGFYLVLLLLRLAAISWLAIQAMRRCLDAERDPVRAPEDGSPGRDDPLGGPVDEAPTPTLP
jgi:hypothetical protein